MKIKKDNKELCKKYCDGKKEVSAIGYYPKTKKNKSATCKCYFGKKKLGKAEDGEKCLLLK